MLEEVLRLQPPVPDLVFSVKETFEFADRLYITNIHHEFAGDTFFPIFDEAKWELKSLTKGIKDEKNPYDYEFCLYERKK